MGSQRVGHDWAALTHSCEGAQDSLSPLSGVQQQVMTEQEKVEEKYSVLPGSRFPLQRISQQTLSGFPDLHVSLLPAPFLLLLMSPFQLIRKKDYLAFIQQMATEPSLWALHCARGGGSAGWESREDPDYMDNNYIYCRGFLLSEK